MLSPKWSVRYRWRPVSIPPRGRSVTEVEQHLQSLRAHDVRWKDGRAFSLAYYPGPEVYDVVERAYGAFMSDNALNTDAFGSLRTLQAEVVDIVLGWLGGDPGTAGFMTSGGTESILLAV